MSLPDMGAAAEQTLAWRLDPVSFVMSELDVVPDPFQVKFLEAFADPMKQRLGLKACKGPGKTAVLAWCGWHFLATRPHPKIAATSVSGANLKDGLWTEMAKWQARSKFLTRAFTWNQTRIVAKAHEKTWWMSARTWSQTADKERQSDTLAGLHEDYAMAILDEVGSIPDAVMATAEGILASEGPEHRILMAGNPTMLSGPLWRAATIERDMWELFEITGDPDDPERCARVSETWAREQIKKYGRDNPWVLVNVFGKFPPASLNVLLGPDQIAEAMATHLDETAYGHAAKILGVDVGRFGGDRSVIFPRQGRAAFKPVVMRPDRSTKNWTQQLSGRIAQAIEKWHADAVFIDDTGGWGGGVIDLLTEAGYPVSGINFGGKAIHPRFKNRRAEMHFAAADWVKDGGALPFMVELQREGTATNYWFSKDVFEVEEKDQVKIKLNGESPDLWDALCLTFASPVAARTGIRIIDERRHRAKTEEEDRGQYANNIGRADTGDA